MSLFAIPEFWIGALCGFVAGVFGLIALTVALDRMEGVQ